MSASDTDSDPEPVLPTDTVSSLTAFAHLSATRPAQTLTQWSISQAVDTLATLDFRLVRKDTALHGLIQHCASTILALFDTLLQREPVTDTLKFGGLIPDITSILRPSFLDLLFQYRRLFRVIAVRDLSPNSAPLAVVCWVDVVLAKLGDVVALIAAGLDVNHPDQSLPELLMARREEDNLRAAIQLPDNWNMLPSMVLSERVSAAAKRLSTRLMMGRYILCPALSGQVGTDDNIHRLRSTFAEFVRQGAARVGELRSASEPGLQYFIHQERLTSAMAISLFAAADIAQDPTINPEYARAFRPQTTAAAMQLLRFILHQGGCTTQTSILSPPDRLDIPTSIIMRWDIVPRWTWTVWREYSSLHADTIMYLTTAYIRHYNAEPESLLQALDPISVDSRTSDQAAMIDVMIDLIFRFISVLSAGAHSKQLSAGTVNVLHRSCRSLSQWMNRDLCGIRCSKECCKALIILFGCLFRNEQYVTLNELVVECLALMGGQCVREAWKAATQETEFCLLEVLGHGFIQIKLALSGDDLSEPREACAAQLLQFLVIMMSKGVRSLDLHAFVDFIEAVGERVVEMRPRDREFLCETLLTCLATASLSRIDLPFSKTKMVVDDEAIWHLGMCGSVNLFLASAFSLYITSTLASVEPLTCLEALEYLLDLALLICSRHYSCEDEPLALVVLPTICDALAHLLERKDDVTGAYISTNTRMSAFCDVLRSLCGEGDGRDGYSGMLRQRLSSTAKKVLREMDGESGEDGKEDEEYELVFCRREGYFRLLYVKKV